MVGDREKAMESGATGYIENLLILIILFKAWNLIFPENFYEGDLSHEKGNDC